MHDVPLHTCIACTEHPQSGDLHIILTRQTLYLKKENGSWSGADSPLSPRLFEPDRSDRSPPTPSQVEASVGELIHLEGHVPLMLLYLRGILLDIEDSYTTAE